MTTVYALLHEYENEQGEDEVKEIGLFSTKERAQEAIRPLLEKPGFRDHPYGFKIYECRLDNDLAWTEGFISGDPNAALPGTDGYDDQGHIRPKK